ncbi:MAG: hypothetical protein ACLFSQ_01305 [Candidatus Zixiibacteriota bacterium]
MRFRNRLLILSLLLTAISLAFAENIYSKAMKYNLYEDYGFLDKYESKTGVPDMFLENYLEKLAATETFHRKETFLQGALIAGEAIALSLGKVFISDGTGDWLDPKNSALLVSDVFVGSGLVYLSFQDSKLHANKWYWITTIVSFATHFFRQYEYKLDGENAFCSNEGLYALNYIKLSATIAGGSTGLVLRVKMQF